MRHLLSFVLKFDDNSRHFTSVCSSSRFLRLYKFADHLIASHGFGLVCGGATMVAFAVSTIAAIVIFFGSVFTSNEGN
jgi:hypothetical protein